MRNLFQIVCSFIVVLLLLTSARVFAEDNTNSLKSTVNDSVITAKIKSQLVANDNTKATAINVETNNGIVKLGGTVESAAEAAAAIQIAASTADVREVDTNTLYIKAGGGQNVQAVKDGYITAKVKGMLIREKIMNNVEFPAISITVETKNNIVHLSGTVENKDQLKRAVELTQGVSGVKKVVSRLSISVG